jgi:hypothetical protein
VLEFGPGKDFVSSHASVEVPSTSLISFKVWIDEQSEEFQGCVEQMWAIYKSKAVRGAILLVELIVRRVAFGVSKMRGRYFEAGFH